MDSPKGPEKPGLPTEFGDEVTEDGVFRVVLDGYDAVYGALPRGATFNRIWRDKAYGGAFPPEFAHIGFLTAGEARRMLELLGVDSGDVLVDLACGAGGPGLWAAQHSGAQLIGIDPSPAAVTAAGERARRAGLSERSRFTAGTFERTGLAGQAADAVMSVDAFQYAPDKHAAIAELARILRPGGRLVLIAFEVDPAKVHGLPVLGVDPVVDYAPLLQRAGLAVEVCEETPGWRERVDGAFSAVIEAADALTAEMGGQAAANVVAEAMLTVEVNPYPRRVLVAARRPA